MSGSDAQLDRLHAGLSARERVLLLRRAMFAGEKADPAIRATMPREQGTEFNPFIRLANSILHTLGPFASDVQQQAEVLRLKLLCLHAVVAWGGERTHLAYEASLLAHVPIKASEHRDRLAQARAEYVPLRDAAEMVADERGVSAQAAAKELKGVAAAGGIRTRQRGRSTEFELGALFDWLGGAFPFGPDWGRSYEVVPDEEWRDEHDWKRGAAARFAGLHDRGPSAPSRILPMGGEPPWGKEEDDTLWDRVTRGFVAQLRRDIPQLWGQLLALELVAGEVSREFEEEAVLPAELRGALDEARTELQGITDSAPALVGEIAGAGPDERVAGLLRRAVRRDEGGW